VTNFLNLEKNFVAWENAFHLKKKLVIVVYKAREQKKFLKVLMRHKAR